MTSIDTTQSLTQNLLSSASQSSTALGDLANVTEQSVNTASTLTTLGKSFTELFTQIQSADSTSADSTSANSTLALTSENVTNNLGTMQNELLASLLGYNSGVNALASSLNVTGDSTTDIISISDFSLDTIKESFQGEFLGLLQSNSVANVITEYNEAQVVSTESTLINNFVTYSFSDDGIGLEDAFDVLNVLEHIPVVSSIYQTVSGNDNIGVVPKLAGDFLYGGPVGLAYSVLDLAIEGFTGTSISDAVVQFDYSGFIFSEPDIVDDTSINTGNPTVFYDKNNEIIFSRD
ncbi:MAG: hypothetical protein V5789_12980 [Colwellia sp.]